jgi:hypothetical protein
MRTRITGQSETSVGENSGDKRVGERGQKTHHGSELGKLRLRETSRRMENEAARALQTGHLAEAAGLADGNRVG